MIDAKELTFEEKLLRDAFAELMLEMRQVGETAPDGTVLHEMEGLALSKGRDLLRRAMENQLQAAAEAAEKKGSRPARTARRVRETKGRNVEPC